VRILLVDPPFYRLIGFYNRYFPLGLVSVATVLAQAGHEVAVYDADVNDAPSAMDYKRLPEYYSDYLRSFDRPENAIWTEVRETIRQWRPKAIGISIWTAYAASAFHVAALSKEIHPSCPVFVGGPHATAKAEEILRIAPAVDYVVRGEGEVTTTELLDELARGGNDLSQIDGLSFRQAGTIVHCPARPRVKDLAALPMPDRDLLINKDKYSSEDMGLIMTSRGCPFSCAFCATETKQVQYRPIEQIIEQIKHVKAKYRTVQFSIKDDSFTVNKKRVGRFCDAIIDQRLHIGWECNTRVDLVTAEMLGHMKRAGCNSIKVGVESGSEDVLQRMNKGTTLDQIRHAAELLRNVGIYWTAYFLIGTPGETVEDIYKTRDFMYEIRPDFASLGVYEPFPGPAMFADGVRRSLVKPDMTLEDFYTMLPNHYYKADARRQLDTMEPERFAALEKEVKEQFHIYNKQFTRILRRARSRLRQYVRSPHVLYTDFKKYLSWR